MLSDTSSSQNNSVTSIRRASFVDLPELAALLGRSLENDPLSRWTFPSHQRRQKDVARNYARLMKPRIKKGIVTTIDCKSVAVWTPPNPPQQTSWERYRESLYMRWMHRRRVHEVRDCLQRMAERHPQPPHWYLLALATHGDCRGQGMASQLLGDMLDRFDSDGQRVALETSKESNLTFYEKFGFVVVDELCVGEGVKSWLMCRTPHRR